MAYFLGINRGQAMYQTTAATSTQSKDVEIQVNSTNIPTRQDLINCLQNIETAMIQMPWPPA